MPSEDNVHKAGGLVLALHDLVKRSLEVFHFFLRPNRDADMVRHQRPDAADPDPSNYWTALLAAACYGLNPANAETVNYIVQRADLYNTLGVAASLLCFIAWPEQRKRGYYLIPAVLAYLSKAPALIYPLILLAYVWLFEIPEGEGQDSAGRRRFLIQATWPAFLVTAIAALLKTEDPVKCVFNLFRREGVSVDFLKVPLNPLERQGHLILLYGTAAKGRDFQECRVAK